MDKPDASDWHALAVADALARQGGAQASGLSTAEAARRLATHGVRIGAFDDCTLRAVTHLDVSAADIGSCLDAAAAVLGDRSA